MAGSNARLAGKVAIITGAAQGIGAAHAEAFIEHGAKVMLTDIQDDLGHPLAKKLGTAARFLHHDVVSAGDWAHVVQETETAFGPVTVLVNNAGIFEMAPLSEMTEASFRRVIDINQVGPFLGMKAVLSSMRRAGGGSIINISSTSGIAAAANMMSYVASKFALRGMTKVAALELGRDGIRVNSVHPALISSPMTEGAPAPKKIPIARWAKADEVAKLSLYLASDESAFCTGAEYVIDGGFLSLVGEIVV